MELSLKKYVLFALKWLIPFASLEILICILYSAKVTSSDIFGIINIANIVCLLLPGSYYLAMFFLYRSKCKTFTLQEGNIINWEAGFFRYTGKVILEIDGVEYSTSAYFSTDECKELVGKRISYAIINETLFIYNIKDQV